MITRDTKNPRVAIIRLNNPAKSNSLNPALAKEFAHKLHLMRNRILHFREARDSDETTTTTTTTTTDWDIRAVVLTGTGDKFSAGRDFDYLLDRANDQPYNNMLRMLEVHSRSFLDALRSLPVPSISAINGDAIGGGLALALATDIRLVVSGAKLALPFTHVGLHPALASTHFLPKLVGFQNANYMLLTGLPIDAYQAKEMGLVFQVVDEKKSKQEEEGDDDVVEKSLEIARAIANNPYVAVHTTCTTLRQQENQDIERNLQRQADSQAICFASKELKHILEDLKRKHSH